ncbi:MAG: FAD-dependent oxidoreductase [Pseudomonadota bacterium]
MTSVDKPSVVIAGAGLAGLAAGTWLQELGHSVQIVEAAERPGGRALTIERPDGSGDRADVGTQYFHTNYRRALALIEAAGLTHELRRVRGRTWFFDQRAPGGTFTTGHRLPYIRAAGFLANLSLLLGGLVRMLRNPIDPFALSDRWERIDAQSVSDAIKNPWEREFTARTLITAGALAETEPVAQSSGDDFYNNFSYLHLIRLMRIVLMTDYLALDGGVAALHAALAARLHVTYEAEAKSILWDGRARGLEMADGSHCLAEHVILAVPPDAAAETLPDEWAEERGFLNSVRQPPALVVTFWLDGPHEEGIWSYVFPPDKGSPSACKDRIVSFCTDAAQKNPRMVPSGRAALQAWICWPASARAMKMDDEDLVAAVKAELEEHFPGLPGRTEAVHVQRHAKAVPQIPPGHAREARRFLDRMDRREGLEICGDFLSGGYMECALWSAERSTRRINDQLA